MDNRFLIIGMGVVFYLFLTTYAFLIQDWIRLVALNFNGVSPIALFLSIEIIYISICVLLSFYFVQILQRKSYQAKKLFIGLAIGMLVGQVLQFLTHMPFNPLKSDLYFENLNFYYEGIRTEYVLNAISPIRALLIDLFLILLFYKNRNLVLNLDSNQTDMEDIGKY